MRGSELMNQEEGYVYINLWKIFETSNPQSSEKTLGCESEKFKMVKFEEKIIFYLFCCLSFKK